MAESHPDYAAALNADLNLHDEGDRESRKAIIDQFKRSKPGKPSIDLLFVYNMLLTGFDAPRLKKLYIGRIIKEHNLLQALTRVNRRYRNFRFGYVVDFAGIQKEVDDVNRDYYEELTRELGDESEHYSQLFMSAEEIRSSIEAIREALFEFALDHAELFSQQVRAIEDRQKLLAVVKALGLARELHNLMRVHKRLIESHLLGDSQTRLHDALQGIKHDVDEAVLGSRELLGNEPFFARSVMPIVMRHFRDHPPEPNAETRQWIQRLLVNEYLAESQGRMALI